jgi:iron complex outermembrane receptor protein
MPRYEEEVLVEGRATEVPTSSTTWAKFPALIQETPASVGVVPSVVLESQDSRVLGDAVRNVSGVNVATGFGVFDFFTIRGFDSLDTGLVLTDGALEPESSFYQLYNVERVEVLKGPSAFLYGGNPLSGTVNLVRKEPQYESFSNFEFSYGSFATYRGTADVNWARSDDRLAFRLNGLYTSSSFYRDDKSNHLAAINPALTFHLNHTTPLTINFEYVGNQYEPDTGLPLLDHQLPDIPRTRSYQSPLDRSDQDIYRFRVDLRTEVHSNITLQNKFYFTDLNWQSDGTLLAGAFPNRQGDPQVVRSLMLLDDRRKLAGNQLEALFDFSTGSVEHKLLAGIEARRLTDVFTLDVAALPNIDLLDPVETTTEPLYILPGQSSAANARTLNFAPYVLDRLTFSQKLQVFLGGRWDTIDYKDPVSDTNRDTSDFSPMLGTVFSLNPDLSFYANTGRSFAPPSSRIVGERQPEESWQVEVGAKKRIPARQGSLTAAFYQLERTNIGIPDESGFTQQIGSQRSRGIELELAVEMPRGWLTLAAYAYNDSVLTEFAESVFTGRQPPFVTLDRSGNRAPFAPKHIFNAWTMRHFANGLGIGGGIRYLSRQFIAPDNAFAIDGYVTLDATLSYQHQNWLLKLNFKNLTNQEYETRGFGNSAVIPADPFAVYANLQFWLGS